MANPNISETEDPTETHGMEKHEIKCPNVGKLTAYVQGKRSSTEVVILTVHDLGCNHTQYLDFVSHPKMHRIRHRSVWVHVVLPGQELEASDFPSGYVFPTMQKLGEDIVHVLDELKIKEVICFGEGAGANILARFAIAHVQRVLGVCLLHCTGTTAGFLSSLKDKVITWKMDHIGMNPTAEAYLILHRYGMFHQAEDKDQLRIAIENYQALLRTGVNARNLKKFCDAFLKRTSIAENIKKVTCPVLLMTGQKSVFKETTNSLYQTLVKHCSDKGKVEFLEIQGVANIFDEKPDKLVESFQYFLQGLGVVSSVPMHHISSKPIRMRSYSMEEADKPRLMRGLSGDSEGNSLGTSPVTMGMTPPMNSNSPKAEALPQQPVTAK